MVARTSEDRRSFRRVRTPFVNLVGPGRNRSRPSRHRHCHCLRHRLVSSRRRRRRSAGAPWDSAFVKHGSKNILFSRSAEQSPLRGCAIVAGGILRNKAKSRFGTSPLAAPPFAGPGWWRDLRYCSWSFVLQESGRLTNRCVFFGLQAKKFEKTCECALRGAPFAGGVRQSCYLDVPGKADPLEEVDLNPGDIQLIPRQSMAG